MLQPFCTVEDFIRIVANKILKNLLFVKFVEGSVKSVDVLTERIFPTMLGGRVSVITVVSGFDTNEAKGYPCIVFNYQPRLQAALSRCLQVQFHSHQVEARNSPRFSLFPMVFRRLAGCYALAGRVITGLYWTIVPEIFCPLLGSLFPTDFIIIRLKVR